jgi:hypothetical protein
MQLFIHDIFYAFVKMTSTSSKYHLPAHIDRLTYKYIIVDIYPCMHNIAV